MIVEQQRDSACQCEKRTASVARKSSMEYAAISCLPRVSWVTDPPPVVVHVSFQLWEMAIPQPAPADGVKQDTVVKSSTSAGIIYRQGFIPGEHDPNLGVVPQRACGNPIHGACLHVAEEEVWQLQLDSTATPLRNRSGLWRDCL